jgi:hypothetical protein
VIVDLLLYSALVPALVAAAVAVGLGRVAPLRSVGGVLALAVAYVAAHVALTGWHGVAPTDVTHYLPHIALAAAALVVLALVLGRPAPLGALASVTAAAIASWLLLEPFHARLEVLTFAGLVAGATAALALHSVLWAGAVQGANGTWVAGTLGLAAAVLAATAAASGSLIVGELTGAVAASIVAIAVADRVLGLGLSFDALARTAGTLLGACGVLAAAYSETPVGALGLFFAAPLTVWILRAVAPAKLRLPVRHGLQVGSVLLLCVAGAAWAALPQTGGSDSDAGYGYESSGGDSSGYDYGYE